MVKTRMAVDRTGSLVFIDDVAADRSRRMNYDGDEHGSNCVSACNRIISIEHPIASK